MHEKVDAIVIGAGVVGLACARALALAGREVIVLERNQAVGMETSARNSEVIHAGIYYPAGSWKARLCVQGREMLYAYCAERGISHRRCGKLIVATTEAQVAQLAQIQDKAIRNGVSDLRLLSREESLEREPQLSCVQSLLSPSTGIVDSHGVMLALWADLQAHQGLVAFGSEVTGLASQGDMLEVSVATTSESLTLRARTVVNAAGHQAPQLAHTLPPRREGHAFPQAYWAKGNYFSLEGRSPFQHLIYPVPEAGGLGVHLTLDLGGQARFGPDVQWIDQFDYHVDGTRAAPFYAQIRKYWPGLPDGALHPAYAGIRPKIVGPGQGDADFSIQDASVHGHAGLVHLLGIESPGLTASLAIGQTVASLVKSVPAWI